MSEPTTNYFCPQGCGAVLTSRTAVAHACGAWVPFEARNEPEAVYTTAQGQTDGIGAGPSDAADLAAIDAVYQTHCVECFMGMPEHCTEGLAPNGQPCVTTPAQRIAWLLDVVQRVVAQRNAADAQNAALTARLAAVEGERDAARSERDLLRVMVNKAEALLVQTPYEWVLREMQIVMRLAQAAQREEPPDGC